MISWLILGHNQKISFAWSTKQSWLVLVCFRMEHSLQFGISWCLHWYLDVGQPFKGLGDKDHFAYLFSREYLIDLGVRHLLSHTHLTGLTCAEPSDRLWRLESPLGWGLIYCSEECRGRLDILFGWWSPKLLASLVSAKSTTARVVFTSPSEDFAGRKMLDASLELQRVDMG